MNPARLFFLTIAVALFLLAGFGVPSGRFNLAGFGLAALAVSFLELPG